VVLDVRPRHREAADPATVENQEKHFEPTRHSSTIEESTACACSSQRPSSIDLFQYRAAQFSSGE